MKRIHSAVGGSRGNNESKADRIRQLIDESEQRVYEFFREPQAQPIATRPVSKPKNQKPQKAKKARRRSV